MKALLRICFVLACAPLAGCNSPALDFYGPLSPTYVEKPIPVPTSPLQTKYYASDEDFQAGLKHFGGGAFGLAQESFQRSVERSPKDVAAWLGLAASYDRLRRFDLADRAYGHAVALAGTNVIVINNLGYSYLLRGDVVRARTKFLEAFAIAPDHPAVVNNLRLLDGSRSHVRRLDDAY
ncbi:MAG: tetratricopeptide repeat protein [Hyphomicrobiales bacterium]|jgi:Flp pilus assembly protein TadD|nr:tetratricopeptide repeat protein [Hyphomicrobiales bacterium]